MYKYLLIALIASFLVSANAAHVAKPDKEADNKTSDEWQKLDELLDLTTKQLTYDINFAEYKVDSFYSQFNEQLDVVEYSQPLVLRQIEQTNKMFDRLSILGKFRTCVHQYRGQLLTADYVENQLKACRTYANSKGVGLLEYSREQLNYCKAETNNVMKTSYAACLKDNENVVDATSCAYSVVTTRNASVQSYLSNIESDLDSQKCTATNIVKEAEECVYNTVAQTLSTIGSTKQLVQGCIEGKYKVTACN